MPPPDPPVSWTFRPRLTRRVRLAFFVCSAFTAVGLFLAVVEPDARAVGLLCVGVFGGLPAYGWLTLPRAVVFDEAALTLRRRVLPDRRIAYADITSFGIGRLVARTGRFHWTPYANADEVEDAFDRLVDAGRISTEQLDGRALLNDHLQVRALVVGFGVTVGIAALLFVGVIPSSWLAGAPDWVLEVVLPLAVYGLTFLVLRFGWYREDYRDGGPTKGC